VTFVLALTALVFSPVLSADFVRLDDYSHLFDNPNLQRMSVAGLAAFWTKSYFNLYIPVTYSVWWSATMIGSHFGALRENAGLFHGINLVVHLANVSMVFIVIRTLLRVSRGRAATEDDTSGKINGGDDNDSTVALVSAFFFAIHPVQVESVAWVSELKGELAAFFGLLGLWSHCRSSHRVLPALLFVLAMLSKPVAIVFPAIALLIDRMLLGISLRKSALASVLYGVPLLGLVVLTKHLQPDTELDFLPTASQRLVVAADAFVFYLRKVLLPFPLAVDYGRTPQFVLAHVPVWQAALSVLMLTTAVGMVVRGLVRTRRSSSDGQADRLLYCGWSIFVVSITPVLGIVPFGFQEFSTVADHYLYLPLFGVSMLAAGILVRFGSRPQPRYAAAALLLVCAGLSDRQARLWSSTETLFAQTVKVNPRSYLGHFCIGDELIHSGRADASVEWFTKSLAINPDFLTAQIALGMAWIKVGEPAKAIEFYSSALARNPNTGGTRAKLVSSIHNNLGMLLLQTGRKAEALAHFRRAVELFPRSVNAHLNLGHFAMVEQRYSDAAAEFEAAQSLSPGNQAIARWLERARQGGQGAMPEGNDHGL
jgi:Flp pilus assembly protein TadD